LTSKEIFDAALKKIAENPRFLEQPTSLLADGKWARAYQTKTGILKLTRVPWEPEIAKFIKSTGHPMLPDIQHVQRFEECQAIWRENLDDVDLDCCPFVRLWKILVNSPREFYHDRETLLSKARVGFPLECHLDSLVDLFVWLGANRIVIRDLLMENWGLRGKQLVIRDFGRGFFF
jgi:hypothetical protein